MVQYKSKQRYNISLNQRQQPNKLLLQSAIKKQKNKQKSKTILRRLSQSKLKQNGLIKSMGNNKKVNKI